MGKGTLRSPSNKSEASRYDDPTIAAFELEESEKSKVTSRPQIDERRRKLRGYFCTTCRVWLTGKNARWKRRDHEQLRGHIMTKGRMGIA